MAKPTPNEKAEILAQFATVDASFRLDGFEKTAYSGAITDAIASGQLTTDESVVKIIEDATQETLRFDR